LDGISFLEYAKKLSPQSEVISGAFAHGTSLIFGSHTGGSYHWDSETQSYQQTLDTRNPNKFLVEKSDFDSFFDHFSVAPELRTQPFHQLAAELLFVWNAANILENSKNTQHYLSFHFDAIDQILRHFGANSNEIISAIKLVDQVLYSIVSRTQSSYEILYLPSVVNAHTQSIISLLTREFDFSSQEVKYLPHLYVNGLDEKYRICNRLRELIQTNSTLVFCMYSDHDNNVARKRGIAEVDSEYDGVTDPPTPINKTNGYFEPVINFHLYFWFYLFLVIVMGCGIWILCSIESDKALIATSNYVSKAPRK